MITPSLAGYVVVSLTYGPDGTCEREFPFPQEIFDDPVNAERWRARHQAHADIDDDLTDLAVTFVVAEIFQVAVGEMSPETLAAYRQEVLTDKPSGCKSWIPADEYADMSAPRIIAEVQARGLPDWYAHAAVLAMCSTYPALPPQQKLDAAAAWLGIDTCRLGQEAGDPDVAEGDPETHVASLLGRYAEHNRTP